MMISEFIPQTIIITLLLVSLNPSSGCTFDNSAPIQIVTSQETILRSVEDTDQIVIDVSLNHENSGNTRVRVVNPVYGQTSLTYSDCGYPYAIYPNDYILVNNTFRFFVANSSNIILDETFVYLLLQVPARIANVPNEIHVLEHDCEFEIICSAEGNPPPNVTWIIEEEEKDEFQQNPSISQFDPVEVDDISANRSLELKENHTIGYSNPKTFACLAENHINGTELHSSRKETQIVVDVLVELVNSTKNMSIIEGSQTTLMCVFRSNPAPDDTKWSTTSSSEYDVVHNDIFTTMSLNIPFLECGDEGVIECQATNYVLENKNSSTAKGWIQLTFLDPPGVSNLSSQASECNGTYFTISWDEPKNWPSELNYSVTIKNGSFSRTFTTNINSCEVNAEPMTIYDIEVEAFTICGKKSNVSLTKVKTGISVPSPPRNITAKSDQDLTVCAISWNEPNITFGNISGYMIAYEIQNQINTSKLEYFRFFLDGADTFSYSINMNRSNSYYTAQVSAITCGGEGESDKATGNCSSDTSNPDHVTKINVPHTETDGNSTPKVDPGGFVTVIPEISEDNGFISCYYVVMVRYGDNLRDVTRIQVNTSDLLSVADASFEEIADGQLYFAVASEIPKEVTIGDGSKSICTDETSFRALSRELSAQHFYDMFLITIVPSLTNPDEVYVQSSEGSFFEVEKVDETSGVDTWIIILISVLVFIILVLAAYLGYRKNICQRLCRTNSREEQTDLELDEGKKNRNTSRKNY